MTLPISPLTRRELESCIHCGLCLPACPTYVISGQESHSPRGRILLMRALVEEKLAPSPEVLEPLESCLGCRSCETACPSGVHYHAIVDPIRPMIVEQVRARPLADPLLNLLVRHVLPYPRRVAWSLAPVRIARALGLGRGLKFLPGMPGRLLRLMPEESSYEKLPPKMAARGDCRGRVILLQGCVGSQVSVALNRAAMEVLSLNGFDVELLEEESCCGAMAAHANDPTQAQRHGEKLFRQLAALKGESLTAVISPIAGCAAHIKELPSSPAPVREITEFLDAVGLCQTPGTLGEITAVFQDPCHLQHAQKITEAPRRLLKQIPGLKLVNLAEAELCCGAAGTYNLSRPTMSDTLAARKAQAIAASGATLCVSANVGCQLHLTTHLAPHKIPIRHVVELLAESYAP